MSSRIVNAYELDDAICNGVIYEHDVKADRFAFEIGMISTQLNTLSGGKFEYNEDCYVIDITSGEDILEIGKKLSEEIKNYPFVIYEEDGVKYLAVCPYDQGGTSIEEVIDTIYDIVDA